MSVALVQDFGHGGAFFGELFEIAHDPDHRAHHGKGVGIVLDDGGQHRNLGLVHHAHDDPGVLSGESAGGLEFRGRVMELLDDVLADLVRVVGDDLEAYGAAAVALEPLPHGGGGKAVENAQNHRLHFIIIHEKAGDCNHRVDAKAERKHALARVVFVNNGGNEVRSAGVGAGLDEHAVAEAHDDAGNQGSHDLAGAVFRGVGEGGQVHMVHNQQPQGERDDIQHTPDGHWLAHLDVAPDGQRQVDQQAQIAHTDAGDVLDHGTDTVEPRGCKLVGEDENLIVQRCHQGNNRNHKISPDLF